MNGDKPATVVNVLTAVGICLGVAIVLVILAAFLYGLTSRRSD